MIREPGDLTSADRTLIHEGWMIPMAQALPIEAVEPVQVPVWAWLLVAVAAFGVYLMVLDNTVLASLAETSHEFFHDARHFIGAPCH